MASNIDTLAGHVNLFIGHQLKWLIIHFFEHLYQVESKLVWQLECWSLLNWRRKYMDTCRLLTLNFQMIQPGLLLWFALDQVLSRVIFLIKSVKLKDLFQVHNYSDNHWISPIEFAATLWIGIAPFRGFWMKRFQQCQEGQIVGPTLLYFGCRKKTSNLVKNELDVASNSYPGYKTQWSLWN